MADGLRTMHAMMVLVDDPLPTSCSIHGTRMIFTMEHKAFKGREHSVYLSDSWEVCPCLYVVQHKTRSNATRRSARHIARRKRSEQLLLCARESDFGIVDGYNMRYSFGLETLNLFSSPVWHGLETFTSAPLRLGQQTASVGAVVRKKLAIQLTHLHVPIRGRRVILRRCRHGALRDGLPEDIVGQGDAHHLPPKAVSTLV